MEVVLYHATTKENALKIKKEGFKKITKAPSSLIYNSKAVGKKKPGTLGFGLYSFSNSFIAREFSEEKLTGDCHIVSFKLTFADSSILDFSKEEDLTLYNMYKKQLATVQIYNELKAAFSNQGHQSSLEGAFLEKYLKEVLTKVRENEVTVVKAMTVTQITSSKGSHLANAYEYCIKSAANTISNIEILEEE